jgi:hypothetical protein
MSTSDFIHTKKFRDRLAAEQTEVAARLAKEAEDRERQKRENDQARAARLAKVADDRRKAAEVAEAEIDLILAEDKTRERNHFLFQHAGLGDAEFEEAWSHLRENYVKQLQQTTAEREIAALRAAGEYRM